MQTPTQPELPMDHTPALEAEMRALYETRWRRWHRAESFEVAMQDAVTCRLLALTVQHQQHNRKGRRK